MSEWGSFNLFRASGFDEAYPLGCLLNKFLDPGWMKIISQLANYHIRPAATMAPWGVLLSWRRGGGGGGG